MSVELTGITSLLRDMSSVHLTCAAKHRPPHRFTSALQMSAVKIYIGFIPFHYFLCWGLRHISQVSFLQSTKQISRYVLCWYLSIDCCTWCCLSSTTEAFRNLDISRCYCSPAICSIRTEPLSIDLPSVM